MDKHTPETFNQKRQELISILDDIRGLAAQCSLSIVTKVEESIESLREWRYEILLRSWRAGTSTLFNVICDGREILPLGFGLRTSVRKISAQSIPADQNERADLCWKSDDELMLTMIDIVRDNLINDKAGAALFSKRDDKGKELLPSLSDAKIRGLAQKAIHAEWEKYLQAPATYDPDNYGRLDLLQISTLILKYYGTPELEALRNKTSETIEGLKPLVVFPCDWAIKWSDEGEKANWDIKEVAFVFLRDVLCHIHSLSLERYGCVITEFPNVLANPMDAVAARETMMCADAILYLIDGTVTEADLCGLSEIRKMQQGHKVFFAINAKQSRKYIADYIRPVDFAMLKQCGFVLDNPADIAICYARLAYLAIKSIRDEKSWERDVGRTLAVYLNMDMLSDEQYHKLKTLTLDKSKLYELSGVRSLLSNICECVLARRMESVLVQVGLRLAKKYVDLLHREMAHTRKDSVGGPPESLRNFHDRISLICERLALYENGLAPYLNPTKI